MLGDPIISQKENKKKKKENKSVTKKSTSLYQSESCHPAAVRLSCNSSVNIFTNCKDLSHIQVNFMTAKQLINFMPTLRTRLTLDQTDNVKIIMILAHQFSDYYVVYMYFQ